MGVSVLRLTWKLSCSYCFAPKELQSFDKNSTTQYTLETYWSGFFEHFGLSQEPQPEIRAEPS